MAAQLVWRPLFLLHGSAACWAGKVLQALVQTPAKQVAVRLPAQVLMPSCTLQKALLPAQVRVPTKLWLVARLLTMLPQPPVQALLRAMAAPARVSAARALRCSRRMIAWGAQSWQRAMVAATFRTL